MGFQHGNSFGSLSSRTGTPNKATEELRQKVKFIIESNIDKIQADLEAIEPKERLSFLVNLMKFVLPTMKQIDLDTSEVVSNEVKPITIQIHDT